MPRPKTPNATSWSVRPALAAMSSSTINPADASSPPAKCVSPLMGSLNLFFVVAPFTYEGVGDLGDAHWVHTRPLFLFPRNNRECSFPTLNIHLIEEQRNPLSSRSVYTNPLA
jgi:hypothetical protein